MLSCWNADPKTRPTFSNLERELQGILDWEASEETDTLYVNVEPLTPPAMLNHLKLQPLADPGFPMGGYRLSREGANLCTLPKFIKENKRLFQEKFGP